jgi:hypothetical protein
MVRTGMAQFARLLEWRNVEPFPYEPLQQWIDLAILNPGIEVHVLDDSRELDDCRYRIRFEERA